jgi:two-component system, OmpR family, phosphate regulon response regulator PhoB
MSNTTDQNLFNKKILLVEDEDITLKIVKRLLERDNINILEARTVDQALAVLASNKPDLIVLDRSLDCADDGLEVLRHVRSLEGMNNIGVVMLTADSNTAAIDQAYELQADEYIVKPFMPHTLKQRIMAVLRRVSPYLDNTISLADGLVFNVSQRNIVIQGFKVRLSKTDHKILMLFCEKRGQIISREEIIAAVWQNTANVSVRTVDVHLSRLRSTLREYSNIITTISGLGYKLLLKQPEKVVSRGRSKKLSASKLHLAEAILKNTSMGKKDVADALGVSISTLYNSLKN